MASHNRTGRNKKTLLPWAQCHVQLINAFRQETAWQALSFAARIIYIELKALYNGRNNGSIMASHRFLAERVGCDKSTVTRCLDELQAPGFTRPMQRGSLGREGKGQGTKWRLTELGCFNERPTQDYRQWAKNRIPSEKSGQAVRKTRTKSEEGVRNSRTARLKKADSDGARSAAPCTHNPDNLINLPGTRLHVAGPEGCSVD